MWNRSVQRSDHARGTSIHRHIQLPLKAMINNKQGVHPPLLFPHHHPSPPQMSQKITSNQSSSQDHALYSSLKPNYRQAQSPRKMLFYIWKREHCNSGKIVMETLQAAVQLQSTLHEKLTASLGFHRTDCPGEERSAESLGSSTGMCRKPSASQPH